MRGTSGDPFYAAELYTQRLEQARTEVARLRDAERSIGNYRLSVFIVGVAVAWFALDLGALPSAAIALPVAAFIALALRHERVIRRRERGERIAAHYEHGLARIDGNWPHFGQSGDQFVDAAHPYAADIDVFGRGSLFQLLCQARSSAGRSTLAEWLAHPAGAVEVAARQSAVAELRGDDDRREQLALIGDADGDAIDPAYLREWAMRPTSPHVPLLRAVAAGLVLASGATFLLQGLGIVPPAVFIAAQAAQAAFGAWRRDANLRVARSLELAPAELDALVSILAQIESADFAAPRLRELAAATGGAEPASREIGRLDRLVQLLDARRNIFFAPLSVFLLWSTQTTLAIEAWRERNGPRLADWLRAAGEYEAFCSLSAFAFEQPDAAFPVVADSAPLFSASAVRHPLLTAGRCVPNDIRLDSATSLLVVSGSNMSGKSTFLRTIGANAVLAQMGAPVCAAALTMSPLQIGTSMRTQDSLLDGTSRFYAEIKRLKQIVDLAGGQPPLLFLFDEILHGTNSHDRRIGAEAIVRTLLERGSLGLITTHDLTLAEIADNLAPRARNVHFTDQLVGDEMTFDYELHDGPVRKSNALGLMRVIGLDV